jgi:molybdate/tungstate transport system substrate-binding protein
MLMGARGWEADQLWLCASMERTMVFHHKLAEMAPAGGREAAVGTEARWSGVVLALATGFLAASLAIMSAPVALAAGKVNVLYAGSLVNQMEHGVGPAFDRATGYQFQGYAGGSVGLANQIKRKLRQGDVLISASPNVNDSLMGAANGGRVSWYITFAQSPLVIGYNRSSKFAAEFKTKPWYQVLQEPGIRIGRTNPKLDPKGALTLTLMKRAETFYNSPGLLEKIIGINPPHVLPVPEDLEPTLLQSGVLDAGFFYWTEAADAKMPALTLPDAIAPKGIYTVTILHSATNPEGADEFVAFLLSGDGQKLLKEHGLKLREMHISGDASAVPQNIKAIVDHAK